MVQACVGISRIRSRAVSVSMATRSTRLPRGVLPSLKHSGYGWWSHDIGGHVQGTRDDELTVRWVQSGVFSPIMRLHSTNSLWMSKEPWLYRSESEIVIRDFMQLRHRLVPYIYSSAGAEEASSLPLVQPLYWNCPALASAFTFPTQFYFGSSLVVVPIVQPRDTKTNLAKSRGWVPPGRHVDVMTGLVYDGDQEIAMYRPLNQLPLLAAEGSIIPLDRDRVPANGCSNPRAFEVLVVIGKDGHFDILENSRDDDKSQAAQEIPRTISLDYDHANGRVKFAANDREWTFRFLSTKCDPRNVPVLMNGKQSSKAHCFVEVLNNVPGVVVEVPGSSNVESEIVIELGSSLQLAVTNHSERIRDLILDYQINNLLKDDIWACIDTKQPTSVKMARLIGLGLDPDWLGPIAELLLADSRLE